MRHWHRATLMGLALALAAGLGVVLGGTAVRDTTPEPARVKFRGETSSPPAESAPGRADKSEPVEPSRPTDTPEVQPEAAKLATPGTHGQAADVPQPTEVVRRVRPVRGGAGPGTDVSPTVWPLSARGLADGLAEVEAIHGRCVDLPSEAGELVFTAQFENVDDIGVVYVVEIAGPVGADVDEYAECLATRMELVQVDPPAPGVVMQTRSTVRYYPEE